MNYNQIEYFLAIVNCGTFSRAAESLFLSQSSLSKQIKALEEELSRKLFDRKGNTCKLTETGTIFLKYALVIKQQHTELLESIGNYNSNWFTIKLGSLPILSLPSYGFTTKIADFQEQYINYNVEYLEKDQRSILALLNNHELDFAILRTDNLNIEEYNILNLCIDEFVLLCSKNHPFADKKMVELYELENEKFLLLEQKSQIYHICMDSLKKANIKPQIIYANTRHNIILEMVAKGLGITIMPKNIILGYGKMLHTIKIKEKIISTVGLVCDKKIEQTKPCTTFWDFFADKAQTMTTSSA